MHMSFYLNIFLVFFQCLNMFCCAQEIVLGSEQIFSKPYLDLVFHKRVGLVTNHTAISHLFESTLDIFEKESTKKNIILAALFAPEHGFYGEEHAAEKVASTRTSSGIPIFSLHGDTRRPTTQMLKNIDVLVYDVQDIGSRSYTYISTLFYVMEEAAKHKIPVVVLDRPNPLGGLLVDGPMLQEAYRSFVGYVNVPYCHGMTSGELAVFFNEEYRIGCCLHVVPMKGWKRSMRFFDTGLPWIPTSPNIPDAYGSFFYPTTGILGEVSLVNIGIGSSLAFKVVVAPWIVGSALAKKLNKNAPPGIHFQPFRVKPYAGSLVGKSCDGVLLLVTNWKEFNPIQTLYWIMDGLKQLYPDLVKEKLKNAANLSLFYKVCGCRDIYDLWMKEDKPYQKLQALDAGKRAEFLKIRKKYLHPAYK